MEVHTVNLKKWLMIIRAPFLPLSVILMFLGTCVAWFAISKSPGSYEAFNLGHALLGLLGLILAHISVNVFNEYYDYKSGVDLKTKKTPFSGGSGAIPSGIISPRQAFWLGLISFILAVPIGVYFTIVKGWLLLPLLLVAALCIFLYTPYILKTKWPEWSPGLGMGTLPVLGAYFIQTGEYTLPAIIAAIPSGILVHNLLLLNEFPDTEADSTAGRKTTPITMGKGSASIVYSVLTVLAYIWIIGAVIAGQLPVFSLIAVLTLPFAIKAIGGSRKHQDIGRLIPAMANNVLVVLVTQLLLGLSFIPAVVFLT